MFWGEMDDRVSLQLFNFFPRVSSGSRLREMLSMRVESTAPGVEK